MPLPHESKYLLSPHSFSSDVVLNALESSRPGLTQDEASARIKPYDAIFCLRLKCRESERFFYISLVVR
jgi:hypothetical protein